MKIKSALVAGGLVVGLTLPIIGRAFQPNGFDIFFRRIDVGDEAKIIYVDGGGDIHNFNTTSVGKYKYNELETLCNEWSTLHPGYKVIVNKTSSNGSRDVLIPQLQGRTAPSIIFQNGTNVNSDLGSDYYLELTDYLEKENPYAPRSDGSGNMLWKELYNENELASTQASDGKYYYINLEKNTVGLLYNADLLSGCGISNPEEIKTFEQLMSAMETARNHYSSDISIYDTRYQWYSIAMESSLFSEHLEAGDENNNHKISTEELCKLYYSGKYTPNSDKFKTYISLIQRLNNYLPDTTNNPLQKWLNGKLVFMEGTGKDIDDASSSDYQNSFNWGVIPYPTITTDTYSEAGKPCIRGISGLATSYWITNRAIDDGTEEACVDLLMFLTAPQYNNRLINKLGVSIPLNPGETEAELPEKIKSLYSYYKEDLEAYSRGEAVGFDSFNTWAVMGTAYSTAFTLAMRSMKITCVPSGNSVESTVDNLRTKFYSSYETMVSMNKYNTASWGQKGIIQ